MFINNSENFRALLLYLAIKIGLTLINLTNNFTLVPHQRVVVRKLVLDSITSTV